MRLTRTADQEHALLLDHMDALEVRGRALGDRMRGPFSNDQRETAICELQAALTALRRTLRRYRRKALQG